MPEFYEDYPLIVDDSSYGKIANDRETIFKIWEADSSEIRIIPKTSDQELEPRILDIEAHLCSYNGPKRTWRTSGSAYSDWREREIKDLDKGDYDFVEGKLILSDRTYDELKEEFDDRKKACMVYTDPIGDWQVYIVFKIKLEKYRSINSDPELTKIAAMQNIQAAVLEYYYQTQLAIQAQEKLNEIAYTVAVTVLSTAVLYALPGTATWAIISEPVQEVFLDPMVEAIASKFARDLGGNRYDEIVWSIVAESAREALTGGISPSIDQQTNIEQQRQASTSEKSEANIQMEEKLQQQRQENVKKMGIARKVVAILATIAAATFGIGAIIAVGTAATIYGAYAQHSAKTSLKETFRKIVAEEKVKVEREFEEFFAPLAEKEIHNSKYKNLADELFYEEGTAKVQDNKKPLPTGTAIATTKRYKVDIKKGTLEREYLYMSKGPLDEIWGDSIKKSQPKKKRTEFTFLPNEGDLELINQIGWIRTLFKTSDYVGDNKDLLLKLLSHYAKGKHPSDISQKKFGEYIGLGADTIMRHLTGYDRSISLEEIKLMLEIFKKDYLVLSYIKEYSHIYHPRDIELWKSDVEIITLYQKFKEELPKICTEMVLKLLDIISENFLEVFKDRIPQNEYELYKKTIELELDLKVYNPVSRIKLGNQRIIGPKALSKFLLKAEEQFYEFYQEYGVSLTDNRIRFHKGVTEYIKFYKILYKKKYKDPEFKSPRVLYRRSALIENLRYVFPMFLGKIPLSNNLLSFFIFGNRDKINKNFLTSSTDPKTKRIKIESKILPSQLMEIDYRVSRLTTEDFKKELIHISEEQLEVLKGKVKAIISEFYFQNPFTYSPYVSKNTKFGTRVTKKFLEGKYKVMRYLYFCASDHLGHPANFNEINDLDIQMGGGVGLITDYFSKGINFGYKKLYDLKRLLSSIGPSLYKSDANLAIQDYIKHIKYHRASPIGMQIHRFLQLKILDFLIEKNGIDASYEINNKEGYKMDIVIKRANKFKNIDNKFSEIVIELTMSSEGSLIKSKTKKFYQSEDRFLLIVLYHKKDSFKAKMLNNRYCKNKDNIKIITFDELLDFLGFDATSKNDLIKKMEDYIDNAFNTDEDFDKLIELGKKWEAELDAKYSQTKANFLGKLT